MKTCHCLLKESLCKQKWLQPVQTKMVRYGIIYYVILTAYHNEALLQNTIADTQTRDGERLRIL